tara:strand:+ start:6992 stop:7378 length:387 start_codon:yes stop_codon:yes gene_type:complete
MGGGSQCRSVILLPKKWWVTTVDIQRPDEGMNMSELEKTQKERELAQRIKQDLIKQHGMLLFGKALYQVLGFTNGDAFRQAFKRGKLPVAVFELEGKRGRYALAEDIANWLASRRMTVDVQEQRGGVP